jgi:glutamate/tyrosine decarboxylase-like PLP-dependent enzyme
VARLYAHASPYTYFSSPEHHPGETTLECSRAGAAAAALWVTLQCLPLEGEGGMASVMAACLAGARSFAASLRASEGYALHVEPELDIVTYHPRGPSASAISAASDAVFAAAEAAQEPLYLAKLAVDSTRFRALHPDVEIDAAQVTVLRSCLMRPEQGEWVAEIVRRLGLHTSS